MSSPDATAGSSPYPTRSNPRSRSRSASPSHRGWFLCRFCGRAFKKHEHQTRHERTRRCISMFHWGFCSSCTHARSDTTHRPFKCVECERSFARQDSLLRHVRLNHPNRDEDDREMSCESSTTFEPHVQTRASWSQQPNQTEPLNTLAPANAAVSDTVDEVAPMSWAYRELNSERAPAGLDPMPLLPNIPPEREEPIFQQPTNTNMFPPMDPITYNPYGLDLFYPSSTSASGQNLSGDEIWHLLTQDLLPGSSSLHGSSQLLAELGLDQGQFGNGTGPAQDTMTDPRSGRLTADDSPSTRTDLLLDQPSFEGPALPTDEGDTQGKSQIPVSVTDTIVSRMADSTISADIPPLSSDLIDLCLNMFWTRMWPTFPTIHASTFNIRETSAPLLINLIALGSLALQSKNVQAQGVALWKLVNRSITTSWEQLIDDRGPYDLCRGIQLIQTLSCGLMFASAVGTPAILEASSIAHANGFRWVNLAGMLSPAIAAKRLIPERDEQLSPSQLNIRWRQWASLENMRRSIFALYHQDCLLSQLTDSNLVARHLTNPLAGPWDDEASFLASSPEQWRAAVDSSRERESTLANQPTAHIYQYLFSNDTSQDEDLAMLPLMMRWSLLDGLWSLILEADKFAGAVSIGSVDLQIIDGALARFYTIFLHGTQDPRVLSVLFSQWHRVVLRLGFAIARKEGYDGIQLWRTSLGRHLLLHANAVRQIMASLPLTRSKVPSLTHIEDIYEAARVFQGYATYLEREQPRTLSRYSLNAPLDWQQLNSIIGTCYRGHAFNVDPNSMGIPGLPFIVSEAMPTINGFRVGMHDMGPFITGLLGLGRVYPRAETMAAQLSESLP